MNNYPHLDPFRNQSLNQANADDNKIASKKELNTLDENLNDLYRLYIQTYTNVVSIISCGSDGPLLHGAPNPDDQFGVSNLAMAVAIRGANMRWQMLNKKEFAQRMRGLLTGKTVK